MVVAKREYRVCRPSDYVYSIFDVFDMYYSIKVEHNIKMDIDT